MFLLNVLRILGEQFHGWQQWFLSQQSILLLMSLDSTISVFIWSLALPTRSKGKVSHRITSNGHLFPPQVPWKNPFIPQNASTSSSLLLKSCVNFSNWKYEKYYTICSPTLCSAPLPSSIVFGQYLLPLPVFNRTIEKGFESFKFHGLGLCQSKA